MTDHNIASETRADLERRTTGEALSARPSFGARLHPETQPLPQRNAGGENIKRIAEFLVRCTWRELETIAEGIKAESKNINEWAEGITGERPA